MMTLIDIANRAADLSFIVRNDDCDVRSFWNMTGSGDYAKDNAIGRSAADELVEYMTQNNDPTILSSVCLSMAEQEVRYCGIEVGFFTQIANYTIA